MTFAPRDKNYECEVHCHSTECLSLRQHFTGWLNGQLARWVGLGWAGPAGWAGWGGLGLAWLGFAWLGWLAGWLAATFTTKTVSAEEASKNVDLLPFTMILWLAWLACWHANNSHIRTALEKYGIGPKSKYTQPGSNWRPSAC